jgi:hypothetical protein
METSLRLPVAILRIVPFLETRSRQASLTFSVISPRKFLGSPQYRGLDAFLPGIIQAQRRAYMAVEISE